MQIVTIKGSKYLIKVNLPVLIYIDNLVKCFVFDSVNWSDNFCEKI